MRLLSNKILVKEEVNDVTSGGIIIPSIAKSDSVVAKVLSTAKGVDVVNPGDTVLFNRSRGVEIEVDGVDCIIVRETEILYIV